MTAEGRVVTAHREPTERAVEIGRRLFGGEPREVTLSVTLTLTNDGITDEQIAQAVVDCLVGGECIGVKAEMTAPARTSSGEDT